MWPAVSIRRIARSQRTGTAAGTGQLRAVRRDKPVKVEIKSMLPLVGHGGTSAIFVTGRGVRGGPNLTTRAAILARGITLEAACATLIAAAERLLGIHGGDAEVALAAVAGQAP